MTVGGVLISGYIGHIQAAQGIVTGLMGRSDQEGKPLSVEWLKKNEQLENFRTAVESLYDNMNGLHASVKDHMGALSPGALQDSFKVLREAYATLEKLQDKKIVATYESGFSKGVGRFFARGVAVKGKTWSVPPIKDLLQNVKESDKKKAQTAFFGSLDLVNTIKTTENAQTKFDELKQYPFGLSKEKVYCFWNDEGHTHLFDNVDGDFHDQVVSIQNGNLVAGGKVLSLSGIGMSLSVIEQKKEAIKQGLRSSLNTGFISSGGCLLSEATAQLSKIREQYVSAHIEFPGIAMIFWGKDGSYSLEMDKQGKVKKTEVDFLTSLGKILEKGTTRELEAIPRKYISVSSAQENMNVCSSAQMRTNHAAFCTGLQGAESEENFKKTARSLKEGANGLCFLKQPTKTWFQWLTRVQSLQNQVAVDVVKGGEIHHYVVTSHHDGYEFEEGDRKVIGKSLDDLNQALGIDRKVSFQAKVKEAAAKESSIRKAVNAINNASKFKPETFADEQQVEAYLSEQKECLGEVADRACIIWKKAGTGAGDDNYAEFYISMKVGDKGVETLPLNVRSNPGTIMIVAPDVNSERAACKSAPYKLVQGVVVGLKSTGYQKIGIGVVSLDPEAWAPLMTKAEASDNAFPSQFQAMNAQLAAAFKGLHEKAGNVPSADSLTNFTELLKVQHHVGDFLMTFGEENSREVTIYVANSTTFELTQTPYNTYKLLLQPIGKSPYIQFTVRDSKGVSTSYTDMKVMMNALKLQSNFEKLDVAKNGLLGQIWVKARKDLFLLSGWTIDSIEKRVGELITQTDTVAPVWVAREQSSKEQVALKERSILNPLGMIYDWMRSKYAGIKDTSYSCRQQAMSAIKRLPKMEWTRRFDPLAPSGCWLTFYTPKIGLTDLDKKEIAVSYDVSSPQTPFHSTEVANDTHFESIAKLAEAYDSTSIDCHELGNLVSVKCEGAFRTLTKDLKRFRVGNPQGWGSSWFFRKIRRAQSLDEKLDAAQTWSSANKNKKIVCMYKRVESKNIEVDGTSRQITNKTMCIEVILNGIRETRIIKPLSDTEVKVVDGSDRVQNEKTVAAVVTWVNTHPAPISLDNVR